MTCVFVGPTLRPQEVLGICDAICLPPVSQGDVYRAVCARPQVIGIIDGYFSGRPSVWHKEILWAISQGVYVFGSASMGALRAAELHRFGMNGVGLIFESFRDGILEDDDEVAVAHGPIETGFVPVSEPMVNIRATLAQAQLDGVLRAASREQIERMAKSLFFADRTWPKIFESLEQNISRGELTALADWLPRGRVDQKRQDALAMLRVIRDTLAGCKPHRPTFKFTPTGLWEQFVTGAAREAALSDPLERILDELRLEGPESYSRVVTRALLRSLCAAEGRRQGMTASDEQVRAAADRFRRERELLTHKALRDWQHQNNISAELFEQLVGNETIVGKITDDLSMAIRPYLLNELRLSGVYPSLARRARDKEAKLTGVRNRMRSEGTGVMERRVWYFESRLNHSPPDDIDLWIRRAGYDNIPEFDTVVGREWEFCHLTRNEGL